MKKLIRFLLKFIFFIFVLILGWGIGSFWNVVILEYDGGINSIFLIASPIVAFILSFTQFANETIWEWVDRNILNMFSNNNPTSTSKRNEAIGYLKQGNNEYKNGRFKEAVKYYSKAIEIDSNFEEAYNNRNKARNNIIH